MKVRELIEWLQEFDGEMEVRGSYAGGEYESDLDFLNIEERDGDVCVVVVRLRSFYEY